MEKKSIKINSTPKKLCVFNYSESQEVLGVFSNDELEKKYKNLVNRSELRGIQLLPQKKEYFIDNALLSELKKQCDLFKSVFYWFLDTYNGIKSATTSQEFSTPYYIDEIPCPNDEYIFVFNDSLENVYTLDTYQNFTGFYDYPSYLYKVNESFLRANVTRMIDIELLKANGYLRDDKKSYEKLLNDAFAGQLENEYFKLAAQVYKDYLRVKNEVDSQTFADKKLLSYENEYLIIKNQRFKGSYFNRDDFAIDRIIITKNGIFVCTLLNIGNRDETLYISNDEQWLLKSNQNENIVQQIESPVETNALNCIAIKQIIRNKFNDLADKIPVYPIIFISNEEVHIKNNSRNEVIKGEAIYTTIEGKMKINVHSNTQEIANSILKFEIPPIKEEFSFYTTELESVHSVYKELYYDHVFILQKVSDVLWKVKREDYYATNIKNRTILFILFSFLAICTLIGTLVQTLLIPSTSYLSIILQMFLMFVFIVDAYYEYKGLSAWKEGRNKGECYEIKRRYFLLGFFPHLCISFICTFLLEYAISMFQ